MQACLNDVIAACQKIPHAEEIQWDFNPPSAPHISGPWERMIQNMKRTLLIIFGSQQLKLEFFTTVLEETELMLNSRPLTNVDDQPENEEPLTRNDLEVEQSNAFSSQGYCLAAARLHSSRHWPLVGKITATHSGNVELLVCALLKPYGTFEHPAVSLSPVFAP